MYLDKAILKFTSDNEVHGGRLEKPVRDGDNIVASNGKVLVVAPVKWFNIPHKFKDIASANFPDYRKLIKEHDEHLWVNTTQAGKLLHACNSMPIDDVYSSCDHCEGVGKLYTKNSKERKCEQCEETGQSEYKGRIIRIPDYNDTEKVTSHLISIKGACFDPNIMKSVAEMAMAIDEDLRWVMIEPQNTCMLYIRDVLVIVYPFCVDERVYEGVLKVVEV